MVHKLLKSSRFMVIIAVIGSFLAALTLLVYGGLKSVLIIVDIIHEGVSDKGAKILTVSFIELIDLFLVSTIFYIVALGLYELFIDENIVIPSWLVIHNLDDLKNKMISSVILILAVYFLGAVVNWNGQTDLLQLSGSIAIIMLTLTAYQFFSKHKD
jgi:uncharacterized membrane protein YqhA